VRWRTGQQRQAPASAAGCAKPAPGSRPSPGESAAQRHDNLPLFARSTQPSLEDGNWASGRGRPVLPAAGWALQGYLLLTLQGAPQLLTGSTFSLDIGQAEAALTKQHDITSTARAASAARHTFHIRAAMRACRTPAAHGASGAPGSLPDWLGCRHCARCDKAGGVAGRSGACISGRCAQVSRQAHCGACPQLISCSLLEQGLQVLPAYYQTSNEPRLCMHACPHFWCPRWQASLGKLVS